MQKGIVIALAWLLTLSACSAESPEFMGCRWRLPSDLDERSNSDGGVHFRNDNIGSARLHRGIAFFSSSVPPKDVSKPPLPTSEARQLVKSDRVGDFYIWEYSIAIRDASDKTLGHFTFTIVQNPKYVGDSIAFTDVAEYMELINACTAQMSNDA